MSTSPEGLIKLEINHAEPNDSGAYKLVISNPHGEKIALCAVAVKRKYILSSFIFTNDKDFTINYILSK